MLHARINHINRQEVRYSAGVNQCNYINVRRAMLSLNLIKNHKLLNPSYHLENYFTVEFSILPALIAQRTDFSLTGFRPAKKTADFFSYSSRCYLHENATCKLENFFIKILPKQPD